MAVLRDTIAQDLHRITQRHPQLHELVSVYLDEGFTARWFRCHKSLDVAATKKALVLRTILGDPLLSSEYPAPHPQRLMLYIEYLVAHPQSLYRIPGADHKAPPDQSPAFLRNALGVSIKTPYLFAMLLHALPEVREIGQDNEAYQRLEQALLLPDSLLNTWFTQSGNKNVLPKYIENVDYDPSVINFCRFVRAFMEHPYNGRLQNKIPASVKTMLGISKGLPALYSALDLLHLVLEGLLGEQAHPQIGALARRIREIPASESAPMQEAIEGIGWITPMTARWLSTPDTAAGRGASICQTANLFNKVRALNKYNHEVQFRPAYEQIDLRSLAEYSRRAYGAEVNINGLLGQLMASGDPGIGLRDLINIHYWAAQLSELTEGEGIEYSEHLPYVALWRLGIEEQDSSVTEAKARSQPRPETRRYPNHSLDRRIEELLAQGQKAVWWRPGVPVPAGATVYCPRPLIEAVAWPPGCRVVGYGPIKISPENDLFLSSHIPEKQSATVP